MYYYSFLSEKVVYTFSSCVFHRFNLLWKLQVFFVDTKSTEA